MFPFLSVGLSLLLRTNFHDDLSKKSEKKNNITLLVKENGPREKLHGKGKVEEEIN